MSNVRTPNAKQYSKFWECAHFIETIFLLLSFQFTKTLTSIIFRSCEIMRHVTDHDKNQYFWLQNVKKDPRAIITTQHDIIKIAHMQLFPPTQIIKSSSHLCFPPVALLLVQLPWWRFHPKGCSPSRGRDASLAPGGPWKPPNGFQNGADFGGGKNAVVERSVFLTPL